MNRRFLISALAVFLVLSVWWGLAPSKAQKMAHSAKEALARGDTALAEASIFRIIKKRLSAPTFLYTAYLEHVKGNYSLSNSYLNEANAGKTEAILLDMRYLRCANAYLQYDRTKFLSMVPMQEPGHFSLLFNALGRYLQQDYENAILLFEQVLATEYETENKTLWYPQILKRKFSSLFVKLKMAHCFMELGQIERGRTIVETALHQISAKCDPSGEDRGALLLGLSYIKEANQFAPEERESFYKLAHFYFESLSADISKFTIEKKRVVQALSQEITSLVQMDLSTLHTSTTSDLEKTVLNFIYLLEKWGEEEALDQLADTLGETFLHSLQAKYASPSFCQELVHGHARFIKALNSRMERTLLQLIFSHSFEAFVPLWERCHEQEGVSDELQFKVSQALLAVLPELITQGTDELDHARLAIKLWLAHEASSAKQEELAHSIGSFAKHLWNRGGSETKAASLMQISLDLNPSFALRQDFTSFLTHLYRAAEKANTKGRMCLILDAFANLELSETSLVSAEKVSNTLADCHYLIRSCQYPLAKEHASWVLRVEPNNQKALSFLGLAHYHLGEFDNALASLSKIHSPDEPSRQALVHCIAIAMQNSEKHLATCDAIAPQTN